MAIVRLAYAADLPGPEEALRRLQSGQPTGGGHGSQGAPGSGGGGARAAAAPRPEARSQPRTAPQNFEDVVAMIGERRDVRLKLDVERYVRPVAFRAGAIEFEPARGCPDDLARRLALRLKEWTGERWLVAAQGGGGGEGLYERQRREESEVRARIAGDPFIQSVMETFPGTEIVSIRALGGDAAPPPGVGTPDDGDED